MGVTGIPKDLSKVKTKIALNMTKKQLICFSIAGVVGIPIYFLSRTVIGNSAAVLVMIALMFPFFFIAMFERDGQPAEKIICNMIRVRLLWPGKRPYKTENFYEIIQREEDAFAETSEKSERTKKASAGKHKQIR